jgi:hypothetical protein
MSGEQVVRPDKEEFVLDINGQQYPVSSVQELMSLLQTALNKDYLDLALSQISDKEPGKLEKVVYGTVGLKPPKILSEMEVLINISRNKAFLTFVDQEDVSFHSVNPVPSEEANEKICFFLGNGQQDYYTGSECVDTKSALQALTYFFETGAKPESIRWIQDCDSATG